MYSNAVISSGFSLKFTTLCGELEDLSKFIYPYHVCGLLGFIQKVIILFFASSILFFTTLANNISSFIMWSEGSIIKISSSFHDSIQRLIAQRVFFAKGSIIIFFSSIIDWFIQWNL